LKPAFGWCRNRAETKLNFGKKFELDRKNSSKIKIPVELEFLFCLNFLKNLCYHKACFYEFIHS